VVVVVAGGVESQRQQGESGAAGAFSGGAVLGCVTGALLLSPLLGGDQGLLQARRLHHERGIRSR